MKSALLLLSLPLFALAAPEPVPPAAAGGVSTTSSSSVETYIVVVAGGDPRPVAKIMGQFGLAECDLRHVYDNPAFKGFSADLPKECVSQINPKDFLMFGRSAKIQPLAETKLVAPWGLKRISQEKMVEGGRKSFSEPVFEHYVFDGPARDLGKGVDIYILDSGVNTGHQKFGRRVESYYTFDGVDTDDHGHGTHVAGIAGAETFGVAQGANIISMRVFGVDNGATEHLLAAIDKMIKRHEVHKKSDSFRGSVATMSNRVEEGGDPDGGIDNIIKRAVDLGIHFAVAAGNDGRKACDYSPARLHPDTAIVTVGAIDERDKRLPSSNFGDCVAIYAPGFDIVSTSIGSDTATKVRQGTSTACPHVAGLMAVFLAKEESLRLKPSKLKEKILEMAVKNEGGLLLIANNGKKQGN